MNSSEINIFWRDYKFFPYEKKLALREIDSLLSPSSIQVDTKKVTLTTSISTPSIENLVYFSHAAIENEFVETWQNRAELKSNSRAKRQNTRYSVHGIHEYKGKFNPQVVRALFNIYGIGRDSIVLDPFCGSGTTLVEAAHLGIQGIGTDINPLAVFIANTKLKCLNVQWEILEKEFQQLIKNFSLERSSFNEIIRNTERISYLRKWFPEETLVDIECLRMLSSNLLNSKDLILVIVSNLLRDYSFQEPKDLRVRRRKSPLPSVPLFEELQSRMRSVIVSIKDFQDKFGSINSDNLAVNIDINQVDNDHIDEQSIDFAITSPPYATALPYIDTQRLSLVWLSIIEAKNIKNLETDLIGSREYKIKKEQNEWNHRLAHNSNNLPSSVHKFCLNLHDMLNEDDGFRKKALPSLLYRYFTQMKDMFEKIEQRLKPGSHFALIVGHNHTTIGGTRTDIDTPKLLVELALSVGYGLTENTPLEVYHRYGLNSSNAVNKESLIVLTKSS